MPELEQLACYMAYTAFLCQRAAGREAEGNQHVESLHRN